MQRLEIHRATRYRKLFYGVALLFAVGTIALWLADGQFRWRSIYVILPMIAMTELYAGKQPVFIIDGKGIKPRFRKMRYWYQISEVKFLLNTSDEGYEWHELEVHLYDKKNPVIYLLSHTETNIRSVYRAVKRFGAVRGDKLTISTSEDLKHLEENCIG